jgi:hypothetical protein
MNIKSKAIPVTDSEGVSSEVQTSSTYKGVKLSP